MEVIYEFAVSFFGEIPVWKMVIHTITLLAAIIATLGTVVLEIKKSPKSMDWALASMIACLLNLVLMVALKFI